MFHARPMAKVNLTLDVVGRRPDGYHDLRSVFLRIALCDSLGVTNAAGEEDGLAVVGLPCPVDGNLVLRAFGLLRQTVDRRPPALQATLDKRIPVGAGLAGGSSDAAAALEVAAAAWGLGLSPQRRAQLALELGSDVPFFAADVPAALVEGRGERIGPLPAVSGGCGLLLALSEVGLSTARVFQRYDEMTTDRPTDRPTARTTDALADALQAGMAGAALADRMDELADANSLWPAAASLAPQVADRRRALEAHTGRRWLMSGSGPTLFTVFATLGEARTAGERMAADRPGELRDVMLCATDLDNPDQAWRAGWPSDQ